MLFLCSVSGVVVVAVFVFVSSSVGLARSVWSWLRDHYLNACRSVGRIIPLSYIIIVEYLPDFVICYLFIFILYFIFGP